MYTQEEIDNIIQKAIKNLKFEKEPRNLYQPIEYILSIGGKRIRPILCLTVFNLFNDIIENKTINVALALEIFHNFTLLHDDIMDKADTRRNMPTVHKKWNDNIAILSGDLVNILAFEYLLKYTGENQNEIYSLFAKTAAEVCEGQQFDMDFENQPVVSMEDYIHMISLKTAVLLACSAKLGALMAGVPKNICDAMYEYAYELGLAFQITDDYLDTFGNTSVFGKKLGTDIATNKKTWLLVESYKIASADQRVQLNKLMLRKNDFSEEKFNLVVEIYNALGIKEKALEEAQNHYNNALNAINNIGLNQDQKERLENFAKRLTYREQ